MTGQTALPMGSTSSRLLRSTKIRVSCLVLVLFFVLFLTVSFLFEGYIPVWASLLLSAISFLLLLYAYPLSCVGLVPYMAFLLILLPISSAAEYLNPDWSSNDRIWGLTPISYMYDLTIVEASFHLAVLSLYAMFLGMVMTSFLYNKARISPKPWPKSKMAACFISKKAFYAALFLCFVALAYLSPSGNILNMAYIDLARSEVGASGATLYIFFYVFLIMLFIESQYSGYKSGQRWAIVVLVIYVVFFQFLKGNRECVPLILAFFYVWFLFSPINSPLKKTKFWMIFAVVVIASTGLLGVIRGQIFSGVLIGRDFSIDLIYIFTSGTWSAVMLTQLSVVGDLATGLKTYLHGESYWNEILSLPPGILADAIGYHRPVTYDSNLALQVSDGLGGIFFPVVAFWNFSVLGVLVVMFVTGSFIFSVSIMSMQHRYFFVCLSAVVAVVLPHWFWYGEITLVRAMESFIIIYPLIYILKGVNSYSFIKKRNNLLCVE